MTEEVKTLGQILNEADEWDSFPWERMPAAERALNERMAAAVEAEVLRRQAAEVEALRADAARYRWLREQIKSGSEARVAAQAMLWNHNSRTELDAAIDAAMLAAETKE